MMYGNGYSGWGMALMSLLWLALIASILWSAVLVARRLDAVTADRRAPESARAILDRRFAQGEIDADTYAQALERLTGSGPTRQ